MTSYTNYTPPNESRPSSSTSCTRLECDNTSPTCQIALSTTQWSNSNITATASCHETGSPVSGCTQSTQNQTLTSNGQVANFTVSDKAGNQVSCQSNAAKIDKLAPSCAVALEPSGWVDESEEAKVVATCTDQNASSSSGNSGCLQNTKTEEIAEAREVTLTVADQAGNTTTCESVYPKIHYVEIRGLQNTEPSPALKQELTNIIRQNVADLTRNQFPNPNNNILNYNLNNSSIAYYEGDVSLDAFTVSGKKTIIVKGGNLYLK